MIQVLYVPRFREVIMLDKRKKQIFSAELTKYNKIVPESKGLLVEVCQEIADQIESHFKIKVQDFGINVRNEYYNKLIN